MFKLFKCWWFYLPRIIIFFFTHWLFLFYGLLGLFYGDNIFSVTIGFNMFRVFLCSLQFLIFWHSFFFLFVLCVCLGRRLCSGYDDLGWLSCLTNEGLWKPNRELMWGGLTGEQLRWSGDCSNRWQMALSGDCLSEVLSFHEGNQIYQ